MYTGCWGWMTNCTTVPGDKVISLRDVPEMKRDWELGALTIVLWRTVTVLVVTVAVVEGRIVVLLGHSVQITTHSR